MTIGGCACDIGAAYAGRRELCPSVWSLPCSGEHSRGWASQIGLGPVPW